jgi:ectopic P granules protein 5
VPKTEDLEVLASWLLNYDFDSIENTTSRVIFAYMNWNFDGNNELFLPHEIHVRMAFLVCEVYMKHVNEAIGSGVMETARQVGSGKKNPSKKEQFSMWCWSMVSVLRLHYMDLNKQTVVGLLENPGMINMIPEIEETSVIFQGFTEQKPLAIYLSVLVSRLGHSIPQICHRGFEQLVGSLTVSRSISKLLFPTETPPQRLPPLESHPMPRADHAAVRQLPEQSLHLRELHDDSLAVVLR